MHIDPSAQGAIMLLRKLSYGFASTDLGAFHRISAGLQVDRLFDSGAWEFGPQLRLGIRGSSSPPASWEVLPSTWSRKLAPRKPKSASC